jgi:hypothetical protein
MHAYILVSVYEGMTLVLNGIPFMEVSNRTGYNVHQSIADVIRWYRTCYSHLPTMYLGQYDGRNYRDKQCVVS